MFNSNEETNLLENFNLKLENLQDKINLQEQKRFEINHLIENIKSSELLSKLNHLLLQANDALLFVNESITLLSNLKNNLVSLNNSISDSNLISVDMEFIKTKIVDIDGDFTHVYTIVSSNDLKTDTILLQIKDAYLNPANTPENTATISFKNIIETDLDFLEDHNYLVISEKTKSIFLPYTVAEIKKYIEKYPKEYSSYKDVILKQFVLDISQFNRFPAISRFKEGYSLMRDCEAKSVSESIRFGLSIMFKSNLYPAIIPACKSEAVLNEYLSLLDNNHLEDFNNFEIKFEMNPSKIYLHNNKEKKEAHDN